MDNQFNNFFPDYNDGDGNDPEINKENEPEATELPAYEEIPEDTGFIEPPLSAGLPSESDEAPVAAEKNSDTKKPPIEDDQVDSWVKPITELVNSEKNSKSDSDNDPVEPIKEFTRSSRNPSSTYSYTAGTNPGMNRDNPRTFASQDGDRATYVPHTTPPRATPSSQKKRKSGVPVAVFVICLIAGIVLSCVFGAMGVKMGYKAAIHNTTGNSELDATPSEKVQVDLPEGTVAAAAQLAGDSVVEITTETLTTNFFYGQFVQSGAGSGVIIDADDGYIITCAHVVDGASTVTVTLKNGTKYDAELVGSDTRTDIAVIKINGKDLVAAKLGNSDNLVVGQTAIAIGNPLGTLGGTVSSGIISALNREITIDNQGYSLLQIDTSINPGNSGGGLFDIEGNLIGVVNAKSGGDGSGTTIEGLGFAIPINQAIEVAKSLTDNGYVAGRVSLGIYVYEVDETTNSAQLYQSEYADLLNYITDNGVYFLEYQKGQKGGFEFGDRIIALDGVSVSNRSDISSLLEEYEVGDEITITVSRLNSDMKRSRIVTFDTILVEMVPETE